MKHNILIFTFSLLSILALTSAKDVTINLSEDSSIDPKEMVSSIVATLNNTQALDSIDSAYQKDSLDEIARERAIAMKDSIDSMDRAKFDTVSLKKVESVFVSDNPTLAGNDRTVNRVHPVNWHGGKSGTVLNELLGVVYGIYPFWQSNSSVDSINFSTYTRIGYYGLSFTNEGKLFYVQDTIHPLDSFDFGKSVTANGCVEMAHRHNTKFDWIIARDRWDTTTTPEAFKQKKECFDLLQSQIEQLFQAPKLTAFETLKIILSLGIWQPHHQADGVTLHIVDYPRDEQSVAIFKLFFDNLKEWANEKKITVNLMISQKDFFAKKSTMMVLDSSEIGTVSIPTKDQEKRVEPKMTPWGIYNPKIVSQLLDFKHKELSPWEKIKKSVKSTFVSIITPDPAGKEKAKKSAPATEFGSHDTSSDPMHLYTKNSKDLDSYLLIVVDSSKETSAQKIREILNNHSEGRVRQNLLRSMIPIFSITKSEKNGPVKLREKLIFCNDSYYCVGFTPLHTDLKMDFPTDERPANSISGLIAQNFNSPGTSCKEKSPFQRFIERNRYLLEIILVWNLLIGTLFALVVTIRKMYSIGPVSTIPIMVIFSLLLPIIQFTILLNFDPRWRQIKEGNNPLYLSLAILIGAVVYIILYRKSKQQIPSRAALREKVKTLPSEILTKEKK